MGRSLLDRFETCNRRHKPALQAREIVVEPDVLAARITSPINSLVCASGLNFVGFSEENIAKRATPKKLRRSYNAKVSHRQDSANNPCMHCRCHLIASGSASQAVDSILTGNARKSK